MPAAVKGLNHDGDLRWLADARGKAVKIISFLLTWLPDTYNYRVIFMQRDLDEIIASQNKMLVDRGEPQGADDERMRELYAAHLEKVMRVLRSRRCFSLMTLNYHDALHQPDVAARRMNEFLGGALNVTQMASVSDPALYRNRRLPGGSAATSG
jgi:hypothetical protein